MNQFFPWTNEETIGEFISNKIESTSKSQGMSVKQAQAKGILCSFDMPMANPAFTSRYVPTRGSYKHSLGLSQPKALLPSLLNLQLF